MKTLILYYSRTGTTKKLAEHLAQQLGADIEEIKDLVDRSGATGYLSAGRDGTLRRLTQIAPLSSKIADYDLVLLGTPIWSWNISAAIRTVAEEQKIQFKDVALFCTMGGSGELRAQKDVEKIIGKPLKGLLAVTTKEVVKVEYYDKAERFLNSINNG